MEHESVEVEEAAAERDLAEVLVVHPIEAELALFGGPEEVGRRGGEEGLHDRLGAPSWRDAVEEALRRLVGLRSGLVQLLGNVELPTFDTYFVYPEAMRSSAKLQAFRDFLISKARSWEY